MTSQNEWQKTGKLIWDKKLTNQDKIRIAEATKDKNVIADALRFIGNISEWRFINKKNQRKLYAEMIKEFST